MINALRFRLAAIFSCLIALILAGAMGAAFVMARSQYNTGMMALLNANLTSISEKLKSREVISDSFLAQKEAETLSIIYITDNGSPLHFSGAWKPKTQRSDLIEKALLMASEKGLDLSAATAKNAAQNISFTLEGNHADFYHAFVHYLPLEENGNSQKYVSVVMLQDLSAMNAHIKWMLIQYAGL